MYKDDKNNALIYYEQAIKTNKEQNFISSKAIVNLLTLKMDLKDIDSAFLVLNNYEKSSYEIFPELKSFIEGVIN